MRKVKPVFDHNETVNTVIFWRDDEYPFIAGAQLTGVDEFGFRTDVDDPVESERVLFALRLKDGHALLAEIKQLRDRYTRTVSEMERRMGDMRKRSTLGQLDPLL